MTKNILWGVGFAGVMAVGLAAQTQQANPQDPMQTKSTTEDRKVTVQGCLERDYLYSPSTTGTTGTMASGSLSPTPFKLTQIDIIKDESSGKSESGGMYGATKDAAKATGKAVESGATATGHAITGEPKEKDTAELHVAASPSAKVDLDAQVNHKVELVGMMSSKDVSAIKNKSNTTDPAMKAPPLMFKATSVKSIADKCQ